MLDTRNSILRWIGFSVLILLAVTLQIVVFPRIGALPNPLVSVAAAVSLAVFAGTAGGAAAGFACGLLCDALLPHTEAFFTLVTMGAGALTGFLCGRILQRNILSALVMSSILMAGIKLCYLLFFHIAPGRVPISAFFTVGLPSVLASILCVPLIYPLFRLVARGFGKGD
jgi:rod shape-determining protein MreD